MKQRIAELEMELAQERERRIHAEARDPSEGAPHGGEPAQQGALPRHIGRTKGGLNSKLHTVCDGEGRPIVMLLSEGQMSDHKGASLVLAALPPAKALIADRGYDSAAFRQALVAKGIKPCIPSSRSRKIPFDYDKTLYRQRHKVENLFAKLKDWRRIATATTDAPIPSSRPSASLQPSSSGCEQ